jgi:hypothetical protein
LESASLSRAWNPSSGDFVLLIPDDRLRPRVRTAHHVLFLSGLGVAGLKVARDDLPIPWFAIGGITLESAPKVVEEGAKGFAVARAILDAEAPEDAARQLRSLLSPSRWPGDGDGD